ncbi:MAG: type II toxin-antitoxin system RelE/ParE family toxin [Candidatus Moranbacteria bacterium CG_4_10_14_3_um_filter_44_15]|nr:MAG: type II toxin-antitoxin system RelE/ParE family toxin [Candidatus Moranbacteria bacterium CG17_big_fil_post_rev_8_21_14_2_50_44_12]PIX90839.1 MAG: type II toxin-antitoxin system RelE/ParE family toxin [Candidatus Moranbacteria bacterium CG_4_10_14_3_um_filter_44_15]PJA85478.1 MAG: type II toxin-antitoxin system RelE/ParE family toxin [Candidatus Moranbacteria bacterium CG_4_9_14_3_um_filter_44_28]
MEYHLKVKPSVQKKLERLPKADYYRILAAFSILAQNPFVGKKMKGEYEGSYSYRVWPYRIIYDIYKKELLVLVVRVGHRQRVYK